jgi:hypothetical protein
MESVHALNKLTSAEALQYAIHAIILRLGHSSAALMLAGLHALVRSPGCLTYIGVPPVQGSLTRLQRDCWEKAALIFLQQLRNPAQLHALVKQSNNPIDRFRKALGFDKDLNTKLATAHETWLKFAAYKQKELQFLNVVKIRAKPSDGKLDRKKQKLKDANACVEQKAAFDGHVSRPSIIHAEI